MIRKRGCQSPRFQRRSLAEGARRGHSTAMNTRPHPASKDRPTTAARERTDRGRLRCWGAEAQIRRQDFRQQDIRQA